MSEARVIVEAALASLWVVIQQDGHRIGEFSAKSTADGWVENYNSNFGDHGHTVVEYVTRAALAASEERAGRMEKALNYIAKCKHYSTANCEELAVTARAALAQGREVKPKP